MRWSWNARPAPARAILIPIMNTPAPRSSTPMPPFSRRPGLMVKVKEPLPEEYPLLRPGQILIHLSAPRRRPGSHRGADAVRRDRHCLRDHRGQPPPAAARADERDCRAHVHPRRAAISWPSTTAAAACCWAACPACCPARSWCWAAASPASTPPAWPSAWART